MDMLLNHNGLWAQRLMGKIPIQLPGEICHRPRLKIASLIPDHRHDFAIVPGIENLIRLFQLIGGDLALLDVDVPVPQQFDDPLPRDSVQETAIGNRGRNLAILDHENIGRGELRDKAHRIQHHRIVISLILGFQQGPPRIRVQAGCLGLGRRHLQRGAAECRQARR